MQTFDGRNVEYRELTREEQLEWEIGFLKTQILAYQNALYNAQIELLNLKQTKLNEMVEKYDSTRSDLNNENTKQNTKR